MMSGLASSQSCYTAMGKRLPVYQWLFPFKLQSEGVLPPKARLSLDRYLEEIAHVLELLFFDQQAIESLPGGALLGGACEDCNFKDDQSGFDQNGIIESSRLSRSPKKRYRVAP